MLVSQYSPPVCVLLFWFGLISALYGSFMLTVVVIRQGPISYRGFRTFILIMHKTHFAKVHAKAINL